jgi:hypothetical protein
MENPVYLNQDYNSNVPVKYIIRKYYRVLQPSNVEIPN